MRTVVVLLVLACQILVVGCLSETRAKAPMVVGVQGENPDVIWMIREFVVDDGDVFYGLFACYRRPLSDMGPPRCYLAETAGDVENLSWPGRVRVHDGEIESR